MKQFILPLVLLCTPIASYAQVYWQQRVDTRIEVTLDDTRHMLRGFEEINYVNNSPDTLRYLYIHLWPNAYKHDHTEFAEQKYRNGKTAFYYASERQRGFIDSLDFAINDQPVLYFTSDATPDIGRIDLPRPLLPGASIRITTPFRVKIPHIFSRLGHNKQAYFISQWFPKPAVYDRKGWHPMPYLDLGEFYSEFGSYEVKITLPKNYIVMATGNLQEESEQRWMDSLASVSPSASGRKEKEPFPPSSEETKTITFKEDNVHDFAWFADKRWVLRKDTVTSPGTGETVTTWSAFLPGFEKSWNRANEHLKNAVRYYGKWVGPYPYKTIKVVQGDMKAGGGMEYPTVTIIDINAGDATTIIHEAGHNWFYGILASNERDHAWLDEGLNTFYEQKTSKALDKSVDSSGRHVTKSGRSFELDLNPFIYQLAASGKDQPVDQTSNAFRELNYGVSVYYKAALMLRWLEEYMGKEQFEAGMREYYDTWKFRHPYPEDFRAVMQKHSTKDIGWFFDEALKTDKLIDFSLRKAKTGSDGVNVEVKNKTGMSLPVGITAYQNDSVLSTVYTEPFEGSTTVQLSAEATGWTRIRIAPEVPDGRTQNNQYRRSGMFHRGGIRLAPLTGANTGTKHKVYVAPAVGYNLYDGFEGGLLFHNLGFPETRFKYLLAPMYGFRSKQFIGAGSIGYDWRPKGVFREVQIQTDFKSFSYDETNVNIPDLMFARYVKVAPSISFTFRQPSALSTVTRTLTLKGYSITEDRFDFKQDVSDSLYKPSVKAGQQAYGLLRYTHKNDRTFNPFSYGAEAQLGEYFAKINLEGKLRIDYHKPKKALHLRAFAGKFIKLKDEPFVTERYYLNSVYTGPNDYLYDDTYIGRSEREDFGARQISMREGGLKIPTPLLAAPLGRSDDWLISLNIKTDLPLGRLPVRLFADVATFADADQINPSGDRLLYDGGLEFYFMDIVHVYVPLFMSRDFRDYRRSITGKDNLLDGITFSLDLQKINWLKAPSSVFKIFGY